MRRVEIMRQPCFPECRPPLEPPAPSPVPGPVPGPAPAPSPLPVIMVTPSGGAGGAGGMTLRDQDIIPDRMEPAVAMATGAGLERGAFLIVAAVLAFMALKK